MSQALLSLCCRVYRSRSPQRAPGVGQELLGRDVYLVGDLTVFVLQEIGYGQCLMKFHDTHERIIRRVVYSSGFQSVNDYRHTYLGIIGSDDFFYLGLQQGVILCLGRDCWQEQ